MKPYYSIILYFLLIISCVFALIVVANCSKSLFSDVRSLNPNGLSLEPFAGSTSRSLLSINAKQDTFLLAHNDGTIYKVESESGKVMWSFSSGSSIYSSYQALPVDSSDKEYNSGRGGENYIDVGADGKLVWKGPNNNTKMEPPMTPEEFVSKAPRILDGQVILASKKTTVFILDNMSGRMVSTHTLDKSLPNVEVDGGGDFGNLVESTAVDWKPVDPICLTRIDYIIQSSPISDSNKVNWNLSHAEISVCLVRGPEIPSSGGPFHPRKELVWEYKDDSRSSLPGANEYKTPNYSNWWKAVLRLTKILDSLWLIIFLVGSPLLGLIAIFFFRRLAFNDLKEKQTTVSKRKKARRLGNNKNNANFEKNTKIIFYEEGEKTNGLQFIERNDNEPLLDFTKPANGCSAGRKIGKLFVSNTEIAKGSNGTVVLEGNYEGRSVAIKRLVKAYHDVASKEIQNLIASDRHPNIVRWYGVEYDSDFVYLSLERCMCSLNDLIQICSASSQSSVFVEDQSANSTNAFNVRLDSVQGIDKDIELWKANGYPSPQLLKMMRDVVSGLAHLHELGIIHRDLKPQNVLILKQRSLCAKLSDMGISKRLIDDMSSLGHHATGSGSSGWQAPEQLLHGRQTRAVDLFSLGCVLFFCMTGGKHPFGDRLERDINIVKNHVDLFMVEHIPEAVDLLSHLLDSDPELRPKALDVLQHPLFWNSETRLSFLRDTSDRVELEDRENESDLLKALEAVAPVALGGKWDEKMETTFIANIGRYRRYNFDSTRDLLRVIRNKLNHYRELPKDIQELLGGVPEGFDGYFASRFPRFLIEVYKVMYKYCREEECFLKYFKSNLI
ncbi:Protein kinase domain [Macleaya cordata]|uniref:non-specific serine/threonine protein kinase n=1 Tax=Macleaya cordata TaxID=56857 RepID=A0A200PR15_MACCD|nr:Protein kinase domain [Macleaya cordata]